MAGRSAKGTGTIRKKTVTRNGKKYEYWEARYTEGADPGTGKQVLGLLQDTCRKTGRTVIVITHNTALTGMADRIIQVRSGRIVSNQVNEHPVPVEQIEW